MNHTKATVHQAGLLYFLFMIVAIIGEFLSPTFVVPGDAAATAQNINAGEFSYRLGILTGLVTLLLFIFLVERLYKLFRDVDRSQALLMVLLVAIGVSVALANMLNKFAPLVDPTVGLSVLPAAVSMPPTNCITANKHFS